MDNLIKENNIYKSRRKTRMPFKCFVLGFKTFFFLNFEIGENCLERESRTILCWTTTEQTDRPPYSVNRTGQSQINNSRAEI